VSFYRRRVGDVRPSQTIHTYGIGSLIDMPNFSVLVLGQSDWDEPTRETEVVEPRLLSIVRRQLGPQVERLAGPPIPPNSDRPDPFDPEYNQGLPVVPFPSWVRCTICKRIAPLHIGLFKLKEDPYRPDRTHYVHENCDKVKGRPPAVVPVRHVRMCKNGHLSEFPWVEYVHKGPSDCPAILRFWEFGVSAEASDLTVKCDKCGKTRMMTEAFQDEGSALGPCTGAYPHNKIANSECAEPAKPTLVGASNIWFPVSISALSVPISSNELGQLVEENWPMLEPASSLAILEAFATVGNLKKFARWSLDELWAAIEKKRSADDDDEGPESLLELKQGEWDVFSEPDAGLQTKDFKLTETTCPPGYEQWIDRVVLAERLRVVQAMIGFTRVISPGDFADVDEIEEVQRGPLGRKPPQWVPASEVRGEGIFIRFREDTLVAWEAKLAQRQQHFHNVHTEFRNARRIENPEQGFPGIRYIMLHSLSHALIRQFAIECGYGAASLQERVYAGRTADGRNMAGILLYTAAADSEGTLGGLVHLGEPARLARHLSEALDAMRLCASDPLCSEHLPGGDPLTLHGAACHACMFAAETSCERGNKYLDRTLLVETMSPDVCAFFEQD